MIPRRGAVRGAMALAIALVSAACAQSGKTRSKEGRARVALDRRRRDLVQAGHVYYAVSSDKARTFSKPVPLLTARWVPYSDVKLVVDRESNAWVAFEDRRDDEVDRVMVARVDPKGRVSLSKPWQGNAPDLVANAKGAVVAWGSEKGAVNAALTRSEPAR